MSDLQQDILDSFDRLEETIRENVERRALEQQADKAIQSLRHLGLDTLLLRADFLSDVLQNAVKGPMEKDREWREWGEKLFTKMVNGTVERANALNKDKKELLLAVDRLQQMYGQFLRRINAE